MAEFNAAAALAAIRERRMQAEVDEQSARDTLGRSRIDDPDSPQARIERARKLEFEIHDHIDFLNAQPDSEAKAVRLAQAYDRLGELAAEQGDYERAATISVTAARRNHYQAIVEAIRRPNEESCDCKPDHLIDAATRQEFKSPAMMTIERIVGPDGQILSLDKCRKCGEMNAR